MKIVRWALELITFDADGKVISGRGRTWMMQSGLFTSDKSGRYLAVCRADLLIGLVCRAKMLQLNQSIRFVRVTRSKLETKELLEVRGTVGSNSDIDCPTGATFTTEELCRRMRNHIGKRCRLLLRFYE